MPDSVSFMINQIFTAHSLRVEDAELKSCINQFPHACYQISKKYQTLLNMEIQSREQSFPVGN